MKNSIAFSALKSLSNLKKMGAKLDEIPEPTDQLSDLFENPDAL